MGGERKERRLHWVITYCWRNYTISLCLDASELQEIEGITQSCHVMFIECIYIQVGDRWYLRSTNLWMVFSPLSDRQHLAAVKVLEQPSTTWPRHACIQQILHVCACIFGQHSTAPACVRKKWMALVLLRACVRVSAGCVRACVSWVRACVCQRLLGACVRVKYVDGWIWSFQGACQYKIDNIYIDVGLDVHECYFWAISFWAISWM
jgi:hypothetical protein